MKNSGWFPWNGSKSWLLNDLEPIIKQWNGKGRFIEPFVGGGSVSRLVRKIHPQVPHIVADANQWLVSAYEQARCEQKYEAPNNIRNINYWRNLADQDYNNLDVLSKATRFAVCLHTAWGNRWETHSDGRFRSTVNKKWCEPNYLTNKIETMFDGHWFRREDSTSVGDWKDTVVKAKAGDLVYLDPPYPEALGYGNQYWSFSDALDIIDWASENNQISIVISNMATLERLYARAGFSCTVVEGPAPMKTRRARLELLAHNM